MIILRSNKKVGERMISTKELAEFLKVHENTIYNLIKRGLPVYKISNQEYRFDIEEVKGWLKQNSIKTSKGR